MAQHAARTFIKIILARIHYHELEQQQQHTERHMEAATRRRSCDNQIDERENPPLKKGRLEIENVAVDQPMHIHRGCFSEEVKEENKKELWWKLLEKTFEVRILNFNFLKL